MVRCFNPSARQRRKRASNHVDDCLTTFVVLIWEAVAFKQNVENRLDLPFVYVGQYSRYEKHVSLRLQLTEELNAQTPYALPKRRVIQPFQHLITQHYRLRRIKRLAED